MYWKIKNISEINWRKWDELNIEIYQGHSFFQSSFIKPLIKYFGNNKLIIAELCRDNKVLGMLILQRKNLLTWSSFSPAQLQIVPILVLEKDFPKIKLLFKKLKCFILEFLNQDLQYSPFAKEQNFSFLFHYHCTTMAIEKNQKFDDYWETRSKNLRKDIKKKIKLLEKSQIELEIKKILSTSEIISAVDRFGDIETNGWKGKLGTSINKNNNNGFFYKDSLLSFSRKNNALIFELYFNGIFASSMLCIKNKEQIILLKTTFNEDFGKYSPGRLLYYYLIKDLFENKAIKKIEFYNKAQKDQIAWSNELRDIYHVEIFRNNLLKFTHIYLKKVLKLWKKVKKKKYYL